MKRPTTICAQFAFALALLAPCALVHAQVKDSGQSSLKIEQVKDSQNRPPGEDIDLVITNKKMRAESGSKSRYSISTALGYGGGSLDRPFADRRPNITAATGSTDYPALSGSFHGKYSLNMRDSFSAGIGARWIAPLEGSRKPRGFEGDKIDADNPNVGFQHLYRWSGIQSSLNLNETFFTASNLVRQGYVTSWGFGQNNIYDIGTTGLSVGANTYVGLAYYDKNDEINKARQSDYSWGFLPALEYHLTDNLSLHADTNLFIYEHLRNQPRAFTFKRQDVSQNLSLGYAFTRDIYVSPGVSFVAQRLQWERTTWSLSANVNLF